MINKQEGKTLTLSIQQKKRLTKALIECCREILESSHRTPKHYYDRWARGNVYKEGNVEGSQNPKWMMYI
jgi:hypothetical protein